LMLLVPPIEFFPDVRFRSLFKRINRVNYVDVGNRRWNGIWISRETNPGNPRLDHPDDLPTDPFDTRPYPRTDAIAASGLGAAADAVSRCRAGGGACGCIRTRPASRRIYGATHAAGRIHSRDRGRAWHVRRRRPRQAMGVSGIRIQADGDQRRSGHTLQAKGGHDGSHASIASTARHRRADLPFGRLRSPIPNAECPGSTPAASQQVRAHLSDVATRSASALLGNAPNQVRSGWVARTEGAAN
jgi:hypothetical protein